MPDIMLLPIIADIFEVSVDELFGRREKSMDIGPDTVFDACTDSFLSIIGNCFHSPTDYDSLETWLNKYRKALGEEGSKWRTAIIRNNGVLYYREKIGGIMLRKPDCGWLGLFEMEGIAEILKLLSSDDFRRAMSVILGGMKTFTLSSLCSAAKIEDQVALEEMLTVSNQFQIKQLLVDDREITIYEFSQSHKVFIMLAILIYAMEWNEYSDYYYGFSGCGSFPFDE